MPGVELLVVDATVKHLQADPADYCPQATVGWSTVDGRSADFLTARCTSFQYVRSLPHPCVDHRQWGRIIVPLCLIAATPVRRCRDQAHTLQENELAAHLACFSFEVHTRHVRPRNGPRQDVQKLRGRRCRCLAKYRHKVSVEPDPTPHRRRAVFPRVELGRPTLSLNTGAACGVRGYRPWALVAVIAGLGRIRGFAAHTTSSHLRSATAARCQGA